MKQIILITLFCMPLLLTAQSKFSIDLNLGYYYTHRHLQLFETASTGYFNTKELEKGKVSPRAGIGIAYDLSPNLALKSGFEFMGFRYGSSEQVSITGYSELNKTIFSIPLSLKYEISPSKKWSPYLEVGAVGSYIFNEISYNKTEDVNQAINNISADQLPYKPLAVSGRINIGVSRKFTSRSKLFIQASSDLQLNKLEHLGISERLYSYGLTSGIRADL